MNASLRRRPPVEAPRDTSSASPVAAFLWARRAGLGAVAVVAGAALAGWMVWDRHADDVRAHPDAVLAPEQVELRGVAPWVVRSDIRTEVLRGRSLDGGLPLDDPDLSERLRRAFAGHPWVREVVRIQLDEPAAATVEIRCREPVAMVRVKGGLLPVDADGVLLPIEDFTKESAAAYPTIANVASSPVGAAGTPWGDPLVVDGAAIAALLGPEWPRLGVYELRPGSSAQGVVWDLGGDEGRTIRFGAAPGREGPGEPTVAAKVARLRELVDGGDVPVTLDLTTPATEAPVPVSGIDPAPTPGSP